MTVKTVEAHKSSLGLDANLVVLIAYLGGVVIGWIPVIGYVAWLVPLVVFIMEKDSGFVRFHAMQSLLLNAVGVVLGIIVGIFSSIAVAISLGNPMAGLGMIGLLGTLAMIISLIILVIAVIAVINGYKYKEYKIPVLGNLAETLTEKFTPQSSGKQQ